MRISSEPTFEVETVSGARARTGATSAMAVRTSPTTDKVERIDNVTLVKPTMCLLLKLACIRGIFLLTAVNLHAARRLWEMIPGSCS
jgi:hypothetical protein